MAEGLEERRSATRGVEQAIAALKKGAHMLKCGKKGKPKFCTVRLSYDEKALIWYSKEREKCLSLNSVSSVVLGQKTTKLLRLHWPEKEAQSLSVIYKNGESSLDLVCKDSNQAECWYIGLISLISAPYTPLLLVNSTSSSQINSHRTNSCTNSPPSYIQQRSRPCADKRSFRKVHSLYGSPRLIQNRFVQSNMDFTDSFFSPRQKAWSELDSYLEKISPEVVNRVRNNFRDMKVAEKTKEQRNIQMPELKSSEGDAETDSPKDIFVWGDILSSMLDHGHVSRANASHPRLLRSAQILDMHGIACGEKHAAIVTKQGQVFSWGEENGGRLGHRTSDSVSHPKLIESLASTHVKAIAFGAKHTCVVSVSGELYEWGEGIYSLGWWSDQCQRSQWFPHKLIGPLDGIFVSKIACGQWHTAIISSSGQLFTYGDGTFGALGHGNICSIAQPKEVESLRGSRVKCVACGPWHTAAIVETSGTAKSNNTPGGKLFTWGDADRWKLGHTGKKPKLVPTCVESLIDCDFSQASCGKSLTVVLTITGVVFTIGSKEHGQLGNPQSKDTYVCMVEGPLKTEFVKEISCGNSHVAVLTMNGKVFTWGKGTDGQLGLGDYVDKSSPTLVEALEDKQVDSIACCSNITFAICLHRSISSKDQSVCSSCRLAFGFTRKKHTCDNCGSMFCSSCSSSKVTRSAFAPDKSKWCRVCYTCFNELNKIAEHSKVNLVRKVQKEEISATEIRTYTPKLPRIFKDASFIMEKMALTQSPTQRNQELATLNQVREQRWGQVDCPHQFKCAWDNIPYRLTSKKQIADVSRLRRIHDPVSPKTTISLAQVTNDKREELELMERILLEEVKQLRAQVTALAEECHHRSLKVQLYKRKVEETWLTVRHEATKCKAAQEIIKVLTNQRDALSKKLLDGQELEEYRIKPNRSITGQQVKAELPDAPDKALVTGKFPHKTGTRNQHNVGKMDMQPAPTSNAFVVDDSVVRQNGRRTSNGSSDYDRETDTITAPSDTIGVIEQIERGVYVTVVTSPSGTKGIKCIRFSRKHFAEKEAQKWWEENESRVFAKYNCMEHLAA